MRGRLLIGFAVLGLSVSAQESMFMHAPRPAFPGDSTRVEAEALFSMPPPNGFLPVRVIIDNQRKNPAHVRMSSDSTANSYPTENRVHSSFELQASAGKPLTRDLLVPVPPSFASGSGFFYGSTRVNLTMNGALGSANGSIQSNYGDTAPAVLMSEKLDTRNSGELDKAVNALVSTGSWSGSSHTFAASFEPTRMPEDWRAYAGYDSLILTGEDWGKLSPGVRAAIMDWVRMGGDLRVCDLDSAVHPAGLEAGRLGFGNISFDKMEPDLKLDSTGLVGRLIKEVPSLHEALDKDYARWPLQGEFGIRDFSYALFVAILIVFGILVGPVNLFVFAKSGKRHRLFLTTPIISLVTCALLLAAILLRDGVGGSGQRIALMQVRHAGGDNKAYVFQEQISRTGVLFGSALEMRESAVITPVAMAASPWVRITSGGGSSQSMRFTTSVSGGGLTSSGDWLKSRSEQGQLIRAVVPTRGRLELRGTPEAPALVSTFDFPLESVCYIDPDWNIWSVDRLPTGKETPCQRMEKADLDKAWKAACDQFSARQSAALGKEKKPGQYLALSDQAPMIETFSAIRWKKSRVILTGEIAR